MSGHRVRNELQEVCLLTAVAVTAAAVAWPLTGLEGLVVVLVVGMLLVVLRPRVPVALVLWMYGARPLPRWAAPQLHRMLDVLVAEAGLPRRPALYYVASPVANAFVVGSTDAAALTVTDGLLRLLPPRQLATALLALDSIEGRIWERILVGRSGPPDVLLLLRTHPPTDERVRRLHALVPTRRDQRPLSR